MTHPLFIIGRKIGFFLAVLAGVSFAIIAISRMVPGDAIDQISDSPEQRAELERQLGLNLQVHEQYIHWWGKALAFDLGESWVIRQGEPVSNLVAPAAEKTVSLVLPALLLNFGIAILLISFFRYDGFSGLKGIVRAAAHATSVIPLFLLGYLIILALNVPTNALIEQGSMSRPEWFALPGEETWHKYFLCVIVLAIGNGTLSDVLLQLESEVQQLSQQEFMISARARGARYWSHFLPNVLIPAVTIFVNKAGFMIGGVVVVEYVFTINGLGMMIWNAANQRDIPVIVAISFLISAVVSSLHLLNDLLQVLVDPRVRRG
ncbi:MAG: ABC transporter permease [Myxococcota bacterium]